MKTFQLSILSPERVFYEGECTSLVIHLSDGMMGIMAGRAPFMGALTDGAVFFTLPDGSRRTCAVMRGIVSVTKEGTRLLCESAAAPEEIDEQLERRALEEAQREMRRKQSERDYILSQLAFAKAFNNLKVKQHNARNVNL